jgi:hypothetical protein
MIELLRNHWEGRVVNERFVALDSEELYQLNLRKQPEDWLWRHTSIRYTMNSQLYRCPEFNCIDWSNSILMFGCSYVYGVGIDDTHTMASRLTEMLGIPVVNLGQGATDDLFQWANSCILAREGIQPRAVIYCWPGVHRLTELLANRETRNWGSWSSPPGFGTEWVVHETHGWEFLRYLSISVRSLWSCPVLEFHPYLNQPEVFGDSIIGLGFAVSDAGRDVLPAGNFHPGIETNRNWARFMAQRYRQVVS